MTKCGVCDCHVDYRYVVRAPAILWPEEWLCLDCREDLAAEEDEPPDGPSCDRCLDRGCRDCLAV